MATTHVHSQVLGAQVISLTMKRACGEKGTMINPAESRGGLAEPAVDCTAGEGWWGAEACHSKAKQGGFTVSGALTVGCHPALCVSHVEHSKLSIKST